MAPRRQGERDRRELWVLAIGLGSAAALVVAAFSLADPEAAGELASMRAAAQVAAYVDEGFETTLSSSEWPAPALGASFEWEPSELRREPSGEASPEEERVPEQPVFDLYLREALQLELRDGKPRAALERVDAALALEVDPARRARARLYALQLARRLEDAERVRAELAELEASTGFELTQDGVSVRLLAALAAAELLEEGPRALAQLELARAWERGELALPDGPPRLVFDQRGAAELAPMPLREALRERLAQLSDGASARRRLERASRLEALEALERELTQALGRWPDGSPGRWLCLRVGPHQLLLRESESGRRRAAFVDLAELERAIAGRLVLPPDFALDLDGGREQLGPALRPRARLATGGEYTLRHAEPTRLSSGERSRRLLLRAGLLTLALAVVGAAVFAARALRRERALARLKSEFIAGVSHDLRTPLASILLLAENLESGRVRDEARRAQYYQGIRREATRLRRLVDDVLDFARVERGLGPAVQLEPTRLDQLLGELAREFEERCRAAGVELRYEGAGVPELAELDPEALRRMLSNLVDNALRHSGSRTLTLGAAAGDARGTLELFVEDAGVGIAPAARERVFEAYTRLPAREAQASGRGGSGLGLAIVRELARAHGGEAELREGRGGVGARFELHLPGVLPLDEAGEGGEAESA